MNRSQKMSNKKMHHGPHQLAVDERLPGSIGCVPSRKIANRPGGFADLQRWCGKRSLSPLAGCKSPSGKASPATRTECCASGGRLLLETEQKT